LLARLSASTAARVRDIRDIRIFKARYRSDVSQPTTVAAALRSLMRADVKLDEWINAPSFDIAQFPAGWHYVRARNQSRDNEEGPADAAKVLHVDVKHSVARNVRTATSIFTLAHERASEREAGRGRGGAGGGEGG